MSDKRNVDQILNEWSIVEQDEMFGDVIASASGNVNLSLMVWKEHRSYEVTATSHYGDIVLHKFDDNSKAVDSAKKTAHLFGLSWDGKVGESLATVDAPTGLEATL